MFILISFLEREHGSEAISGIHERFKEERMGQPYDSIVADFILDKSNVKILTLVFC